MTSNMIKAKRIFLDSNRGDDKTDRHDQLKIFERQIRSLRIPIMCLHVFALRRWTRATHMAILAHQLFMTICW